MQKTKNYRKSRKEKREIKNSKSRVKYQKNGKNKQSCKKDVNKKMCKYWNQNMPDLRSKYKKNTNKMSKFN